MFQSRHLALLGLASLVVADKAEKQGKQNGPGGWGHGGWGQGQRQGGWGGGYQNPQWAQPTVYVPVQAPQPVQPLTMTVPVVPVPVPAPQQTVIVQPPGPPQPIPCGGPGGWCCPIPYQPLNVNNQWICQTGK